MALSLQIRVDSNINQKFQDVLIIYIFTHHIYFVLSVHLEITKCVINFEHTFHSCDDAIYQINFAYFMHTFTREHPPFNISTLF